MTSDLLMRLGVSLGLGLLVGIQRQREQHDTAGIRTFALISLIGTLCGILGEKFGPWPAVVGFGSIAAYFIVGYALEQGRARGSSGVGLTTEIAALFTYLIGLYLSFGSVLPAVVLCGAAVVLLQAKRPLHKFVRGVSDQDWRTGLQFIVIALVILPILPNKVYGPYKVFNPYETWFLVVLIVAISLGGYFGHKILGPRRGTFLAGILGGLISSTATTVSYARQTRASARVDLGASAAFVITAAAAVVFARMIIEIAVVAPGFLVRLAPPLAIVLVAALAASALAWASARRGERAAGEQPENENPAEMKTAIWFAALYVLVLLASAFAREHFGDRGLYVVAIISGLTDVDAITLSTSKLVGDGRVSATAGGAAILIAALSNLAFKTGTVFLLGTRGLMRRAALYFGVIMLTGLAVLAFWLL